MQWEGQEESENVEDQRGSSGRRNIAIGGGAVGIIIVLLGLVFGFDPQQILQFFNQGQNGPVANQVQPGQQRPFNPQEDKLVHFTRVVLKDTETVWGDLFAKMGKTYVQPKLTLFTDEITSACGQADSAVGPFYCPGDAHVYLDLSFFSDMQRKLNAPGEFARAYVIAHEVGHHVQKLLGYDRIVNQTRSRGNKVEINHMSVRLELQADYFAGVWAHYGQSRLRLDPNDIESALNAAFQIGDDRLQKQARGYVVPDTFTHGSSQQRQRWFRQGFQTGDVDGAKQLFDLPYEGL
jgi:predicted metalloprotease